MIHYLYPNSYPFSIDGISIMKNFKFVKFSEEEKVHLLRAWAALTFAFALVLGGGLAAIGPGLWQLMIIAGVTVGVGFLLHELGHKVVAQKYGFWAEFRSFTWGLALAVGLSFTGFIFAAPGAVMISGAISQKENGIISAIGPIINIVLAIVFLVAGILLNAAGLITPMLAVIVSYGYFINSWLAFFNLIPIFPFDGSKVFAWSVPVWGALILLSGVMTFLVRGLGVF